MALSLEEKLAKGSSDLRFLLTNHGVKDDRQGKLYDSGIDTVIVLQVQYFIFRGKFSNSHDEKISAYSRGQALMFRVTPGMTPAILNCS